MATRECLVEMLQDPLKLSCYPDNIVNDLRVSKFEIFSSNRLKNTNYARKSDHEVSISDSGAFCPETLPAGPEPL